MQVPRVLVCGWSDHAWMGLMLREMDRGPAALPRNSEVAAYSAHHQDQTQHGLHGANARVYLLLDICNQSAFHFQKQCW